ncbi:MAG: branched-chain amino acid ABC transporter permease [Chloroflexota bacterium]
MQALKFPRVGVLRLPRWLGLALLVGWLAIPLVLRDWDYGVHIAISVALYVILALSLNLVNGQAGQLNLGHAAFFGIGAYTAALLMLLQGWSFWATLPVAFGLTAVFGLIVGLPSLRVGGDYLGIVTLGFGEITRLVLINWMDLTRGPMGLPGIPPPSLFGHDFTGKLPYFYLITVFAMLTWFVMKRLTVSKFGLQMLSLREDERVASTLGVDTGRIKLASFAIAAAFAGLAGAFYASYISFISPDTFVLNDSIIMLCMVVLGGMGSMVGSMIGACILIVAPEALRFMQDWRLVLYGVLLTGMMIYRPSGIWGLERRTRNEIKLSARG